MCTLAVLISRTEDRHEQYVASEPLELSGLQDATDSPVSFQNRPVYRHSVVDGGVRSADEVEAVLARDGIVRAHYAGINTRALRAETVPADQMVYMSYRIKDKVYWTKNKVRLPQGEQVLTDGTHQLRARCGNCISLEPMEPVAEDPPDPMEFDTLVEGPVVLPSRSIPSLLTLGPHGEIPFDIVFPTPFAVAQFLPPGRFDTSIPFGRSVSDPEIPVQPEPAQPRPQLVQPPGLPPVIENPQCATAGCTTPPNPPGTPGVPPGNDPPGGTPPPGPPPPLTPTVEVPETVVPEPATLLLLGGGLAALARRKRLSRR